jgi:hypothetical protein
VFRVTIIMAHCSGCQFVYAVCVWRKCDRRKKDGEFEFDAFDGQPGRDRYLVFG